MDRSKDEIKIIKFLLRRGPSFPADLPIKDKELLTLLLSKLQVDQLVCEEEESKDNQYHFSFSAPTGRYKIFRKELVSIALQTNRKNNLRFWIPFLVSLATLISTLREEILSVLRLIALLLK